MCRLGAWASERSSEVWVIVGTDISLALRYTPRLTLNPSQSPPATTLNYLRGSQDMLSTFTRGNPFPWCWPSSAILAPKPLSLELWQHWEGGEPLLVVLGGSGKLGTQCPKSLDILVKPGIFTAVLFVLNTQTYIPGLGMLSMDIFKLPSEQSLSLWCRKLGFQEKFIFLMHLLSASSSQGILSHAQLIQYSPPHGPQPRCHCRTEMSARVQDRILTTCILPWSGMPSLL